MRLHKVAGRFDNTEAADAYNPTTTFKCQLAPLEMYRIEGTAVKKREMSTKPDVVLPTRRVIIIDGQAYLVSSASPDFWNGARIRTNYVIQGADDIASIHTIAGALINTPPATAYASLGFNKNMTDERQGSEYLSQYNIHLAATESVGADALINIGARWFLVRQSYVSVSGLLVTLANEIEGTVFETVNFDTRAYNPITDTWAVTPTSVKVLRVRWTDHFEYLTRGTEKFERGDAVVMIHKTATTPKAADVLTMSDGKWAIVNAHNYGLYWGCHARRT